LVGAYPFQSVSACHRVAPVVLLLASGSPEDRTQRDPVIGRVWATSPRLPFKSGTSESNRKPPAPKAGVLPSAPLPDCEAEGWRPEAIGLLALPTVSGLTPPASFSSPYGSRTHLAALKGRYPVPIDERAVLCVERAKWAGRRSNPRLRLFRPLPTNLRSVPASQLPTQRKKPAVAVTPGFEKLPIGSMPSVTSATDARAAYSPVDSRQNYLCICVRS
jgi:hypothetical protein